MHFCNKKVNLTILIILIITDCFGQSGSNLYKKCVKSIVKITCYDKIHQPISLGSGFFIDSNTVVTNLHVIENASFVSITLSDLEKPIMVDGYIALDYINDLALLSVTKIKRPPLKFYNKKIEIGSKIYSIGNPEGLGFSISDGLVSQLRNSNDISLIQITAPISHGSSGCPILLETGEIIGVAVGALKDGQNLNFAIPYYLVQSLINTKGDITYSFKPKSKIIESNIVDNNTNKSNLIIFNNGEKVSLNEFESVYKIHKKEPDAVSVSDYLELFLHFKMKVMEAKDLGMNNIVEFKDDFAKYRRQLAQTYLTDAEANEKLLLEAYERLQTDIRVSHILVEIKHDATPNDTLKAYDRITRIRNKIVNGEDFNLVAIENSDDPSVKENFGDLGYFTGLQMEYPFESCAYNTEVGFISNPVRTKFGYHLIKVVNKRQANGQVKVAHIMFKTPINMSVKDSLALYSKVKEIHLNIKSGNAIFENMAMQYSEDKSSANKGGELPWFGTGRLAPEFEKVAFGLKKKGDLTDIIKTRYGFHIIKLIDKKDIASFDEMKIELKARIAKDTRSELVRQSFINKLKNEYSFNENLYTLYEFYNIIDASILEGNWKAPNTKELIKPMFNFAGLTYSQKDFVNYIINHQKTIQKGSVNELINKLYKSFVEESIINYEESNLEIKYPEFNSLMKEYRDGILLYQITDMKIWSKSVNDEKGLKEYFNNNKEKYGSLDYESNLKVIIADYQNYLENEWINNLRIKYKYELNYGLLKEIK